MIDATAKPHHVFSLKRVALDVSLGLGVFLLLASIFAGFPSHALPLPPAPELVTAAGLITDPTPLPTLQAQPAEFVPVPGASHATTFGLAAFAFSGLFATNLALWRHLRASYMA
jgi:hypothetical protein